MAGEKRFGGALFGFKKADVNSYIEKIINEFSERLKEKDDEISALKNQSRDIKQKFEELSHREYQINEDRKKIADVLIKAQEKAELMLDDARIQAMNEKKRLEQMIEQEKEKLVDIKGELRHLKKEAVDAINKYQMQIDQLIQEEDLTTEE